MLGALSALWFVAFCCLSKWCHKQPQVGALVKTFVIPTYLAIGMLPGSVLLVLRLRELFIQ